MHPQGRNAVKDGLPLRDAQAALAFPLEAQSRTEPMGETKYDAICGRPARY